MTFMIVCDNCGKTKEVFQMNMGGYLQDPAGWFSKWGDIGTSSVHPTYHACSEPCLKILAKKYGGKIEKRWTG